MKRSTYPWIRLCARLSLAGGLLAGLNLIYLANCVWPHNATGCGPHPLTQNERMTAQVRHYISCLPAVDPLGVNTIERAKIDRTWVGDYGKPSRAEQSSWWRQRHDVYNHARPATMPHPNRNTSGLRRAYPKWAGIFLCEFPPRLWTGS